MRVGIPGALVAAGTCVALAACGLNVQSPDLFQLTRTGARGKLTLLVNDSGTIACNGRSAQSLPDPLLLQARDLASALDADAKAGLNIPQAPDSVFRYIVKLQDGTIAFPDTAASRRKELAQVELFVLQATQNPCKLSDS
jgi:hypothetical protein